ncbi:pseudaminic acid biosynthesis-associated methylase [Pseudodesulfovibrio sediminis]|uniref:Methyltransferase domain-containing protein n=1 Tax=Pseudodesulfovibrio sediminis TaxID=2810563 RepID=A0ABN6EUK2_9BACT|nr:pseudaminic acid biosynthesis-associated methylase [Pseudodesulfovibrio sediminis]BCS89182.1 hypothetical protein PSDVSF_24240 [Pseudodesulfovibrio sediminis]
MSTRADLENFWKGEFGNEYVDRHEAERLVPAKNFQFQTMLEKVEGLQSVIELGTNRGYNLQAIHEMVPDVELHGVEINDVAVEIVRQQPGVNSVFHGSLFDAPEDRTYDLSFTTCVLIHIGPDMIQEAYHKLYRLSHRYILMCEYHNPTPVMVTYRGHENRLFKRDFAGEILDLYPDLSLVDYGFFYSRDPRYGLTDTNYFLLEKK